MLEFSEPFLQRLRGCRVFAMELVPSLPNLAALAERMRLPPDEDLSELLGEARYAALVGVLSRYGIPEPQVRTMQPWAALMTISVPPPETGLFMDFSLSLRASGNGLRVIGLETLDQQLAFLDAFSLEQQRALIDDALAEAGRVQALHDTLVAAYLENDLDGLSALAMEQLTRLDRELVEVFVREGIEARNRRMLETLLPELTEGGVFAAVGALHLPGEAGLIALLEARGFDLRPAVSPFATP